MPLKEFIEEVKTLVSTAQEQKALEKSIQFFSADKKYAFYEKTTLALHGRLQDLNKYSRLNLLTFGEITRTKGKIHLRILDLLQDLEDGKIQRDDPKQVNAPAPRWAGVVGSYISALVAIVFMFVQQCGNSNSPDPDGPIASTEVIKKCQEFSSNNYKVLVVNFNGPNASNEQQIAVYIGDFLERYLNGRHDNTPNTGHPELNICTTVQSPIDRVSAESITLNNGADMLIYGNYTSQNLFPRIYYKSNQNGTNELSYEFISIPDSNFSIENTNLALEYLSKIIGEKIILILQGNPITIKANLTKISNETKVKELKLLALSGVVETNLLVGDSAQAEETLNKMVELAPENTIVLENLGNLQMIRNNYNQAIDNYSKILIIDPDKTSVKIKRADVLTKMDRAADAKKELEQIKAEQKNVDTVFINKKIIQNEAIIKAKTNTTVSGLSPTQKSTLNLSIGNFDAAQTEAAKAIKNSPPNNTAKNNYIEAVLSKPVNETKKIEELNNMNITQNDIQKALNANAFLKYKVDSTQLQKIVKRKN